MSKWRVTMFKVRDELTCNCGEKYSIEFDQAQARLTWKVQEPYSEFAILKEVHEVYKKEKGFDQISTYNSQYQGRNFKVIKKILHGFRKLPDPVGATKELITDIAKQAGEQGWSWTIETCDKRKMEWLVGKQSDKRTA